MGWSPLADTLNSMPSGKRLVTPSSLTEGPAAAAARGPAASATTARRATSARRNLVTDRRLLVGAEQRLQLPVEHGFGIAGLIAGTVVLHHLVRMENVGTDLVAPGGRDVLPLEPLLLLRPLLQLQHQEPRLQHLERALLVAVLGALVLAGDGEAAGDVGDADGGGVL